MTLQTDHTIPV
uniref:Uncharacterized protein n=1 Tax=Anguilla anguilla TaxID=7936 RepID=A0A0E9PEV6_ANGAN